MPDLQAEPPPEPPPEPVQPTLQRVQVHVEHNGQIVYVFVPQPRRHTETLWANALLVGPGEVVDPYGNRLSA